jgi:thiamine-monophosphate kinase
MTKETNQSNFRAKVLRELGEFGAIERFAAQLQNRAGVRVGIGDDCAVLEPLRAPVISCDALVEGVHFRRDWTSPFDLGRKTLAVSVSDLASSGARPVAAFLSLCAPPDVELSWLDAFYEGLESLAREFNFSVAGGDTTRASQLVLSATVVGELLPEAQKRPVLRDGARLGDLVCVTGDLGASAAGLAWLLSGKTASTPAHEHVLNRHFNPAPRLEPMRALLKTNRSAVHAAMDISDGLVGDAKHIAGRSNVQLSIDAASLPISDSTREVARELEHNALQWALGGGEDYELLLCVTPEAFEELKGVAEVGLCKVGEVIDGEAGVEVIGDVEGESWTHF